MPLFVRLGEDAEHLTSHGAFDHVWQTLPSHFLLDRLVKLVDLEYGLTILTLKSTTAPTIVTLILVVFISGRDSLRPSIVFKNTQAEVAHSSSFWLVATKLVYRILILVDLLKLRISQGDLTFFLHLDIFNVRSFGRLPFFHFYIDLHIYFVFEASDFFCYYGPLF